MRYQFYTTIGPIRRLVPESKYNHSLLDLGIFPPGMNIYVEKLKK